MKNRRYTSVEDLREQIDDLMETLADLSTSDVLPYFQKSASGPWNGYAMAVNDLRNLQTAIDYVTNGERVA